MRRFFQVIYWLILAAGLAATYFVSPLCGICVLVVGVPFTFAWQCPSGEHLRVFSILLFAIFGVSTLMTVSWLPWIGVVVYGVIAIFAVPPKVRLPRVPEDE